MKENVLKKARYFTTVHVVVIAQGRMRLAHGSVNSLPGRANDAELPGC